MQFRLLEVVMDDQQLPMDEAIFDPHRLYINRFRDKLVSESSLADNRIFPLRVIHVKDTLDSEGGIVFTQPKDWNFHTISHTWSQEIEQFSKEISSKFVKDQDAVGYKEVFRHAKLDDRPSYRHFVEFLRILQTDRVEKVWFDTLCINQSDQQEKSQEIRHMGAFYFHSLGCYVTAHGFGQGFALTDKDHHLPRWFSRVWTFQEFLLPKRLTFVVELDRSLFHRIISITRMAHLKGDCDCKGEASSQRWSWGSKQNLRKLLEETQSSLLESSPVNIQEVLSYTIFQSEVYGQEMSRSVEDADEVEFWQVIERSGYRCTHGVFQRVQGPQQLMGSTGDDQQKRRYLVDRDAYVYIMSHMDDESGEQAVMSKMMIRLWIVFLGGHPAIVREVSLRSCSNEEDRVLSVLGLLGLDGKVQQLRTGQTLDDQIVRMCDTMAKCNLRDFLALCAGFQKPYSPLHRTTSTLPLSWAPHFLASESLLPHFMLEQVTFSKMQSTFCPTADRVSVSPRGLSLSCNILTGRLVPFLQHAQHCTLASKFFDAGCYACRDAPEESEFVLEVLHSHALRFCKHTNKSISLHPGKLELGASGRIRTKNQYGSRHYFEGGMELNLDTNVGWDIFPHKVEFNVWLLLLGTLQCKLPFPDLTRVVLVFMVCVGESRDNLHKIGIVELLPTYTKIGGRSAIHFDSFQSVDCIVGSFSKRDWKTWILKQVYASRCWNVT